VPRPREGRPHSTRPLFVFATCKPHFMPQLFFLTITSGLYPAGIRQSGWLDWIITPFTALALIIKQLVRHKMSSQLHSGKKHPGQAEAARRKLVFKPA
ncbi:hypothetical protein K0U00_45105, partial [Paenibacillus sepulcri]|nr:hypothetical protein [Paenibacillus sepulcri]